MITFTLKDSNAPQYIVDYLPQLLHVDLNVIDIQNPKTWPLGLHENWVPYVFSGYKFQIINTQSRYVANYINLKPPQR